MERLKIIAPLTLLITLTGCGAFDREPETVTEYQEKAVPVYSVPEPPEVPRPSLELEKVDEDSSDGEVAKAYAISVMQLTDYTRLLEKVINKYREMAEEDAQEIETINEERRSSAGGPPFGAAGPTAPTSSSDNGNFDGDMEAWKRAVKQQQKEEDVKNEFEDIEEEAKSLRSKNYEAEVEE